MPDFTGSVAVPAQTDILMGRGAIHASSGDARDVTATQMFVLHRSSRAFSSKVARRAHLSPTTSSGPSHGRGDLPLA